MSFAYFGKMYGHSVSVVRFSYAKLASRGSEQFIKDIPVQTPPTFLWNEGRDAGNFQSEFPIQGFQMEFDLIKLWGRELVYVLFYQKWNNRESDNISLKLMELFFCQYVTEWPNFNWSIGFDKIKEWVWRLKNTMKIKPLEVEWLIRTLGALPRLSVNMLLSLSWVWMTETLANEY